MNKNKKNHNKLTQTSNRDSLRDELMEAESSLESRFKYFEYMDDNCMTPEERSS